MRYHCTIYSHAFTAANGTGHAGTDPSFDAPVASVVVGGASSRQAAARAYVRCVGRERARILAQKPTVRPEMAAQEASPRAIAASLRRTARRIGEVYELDNLNEAWFIKVEPMPAPRPVRLPSRLLLLLSRLPSPN